MDFPWEDWTATHPPSDPQWRDCYIHIGPASANADLNWANRRASLTDFQAFPVRMSQAGEARLVQVLLELLLPDYWFEVD
jgi:hypothetical protein